MKSVAGVANTIKIPKFGHYIGYNFNVVIDAPYTNGDRMFRVDETNNTYELNFHPTK
jgi:hypothetical protein